MHENKSEKYALFESNKKLENNMAIKIFSVDRITDFQIVFYDSESEQTIEHQSKWPIHSNQNFKKEQIRYNLEN